MVCYLTCAIACAFLGAMFWVMLTADKEVLTAFHASLSTEQAAKMDEIKAMRRNLWIKGMLFGLFAGFAVVWFAQGVLEWGAIMNSCLFSAVVMAVNYFVYMMSKKDQYMIEHLYPAQVPVWLETKKMFQRKYHIGLLVGLFSCFIFQMGLQSHKQALYIPSTSLNALSLEPFDLDFAY